MTKIHLVLKIIVFRKKVCLFGGYLNCGLFYFRPLLFIHNNYFNHIQSFSVYPIFGNDGCLLTKFGSISDYKTIKLKKYDKKNTFNYSYRIKQP